MVSWSFLRSILFPTRITGTPLQKCLTSLAQWGSTLDKLSGLKGRKTGTLLSEIVSLNADIHLEINFRKRQEPNTCMFITKMNTYLHSNFECRYSNFTSIFFLTIVKYVYLSMLKQIRITSVWEYDKGLNLS